MVNLCVLHCFVESGTYFIHLLQSTKFNKNRKNPDAKINVKHMMIV